MDSVPHGQRAACSLHRAPKTDPFGDRVHIIEGNAPASFETSRRSTQSFRQADRQRRHARADRRIVNQSVSAESADTVETFAGFQIALGNSHHFTNRTCQWVQRSDRDESPPGRWSTRSEVRQVERRIEDIERTIAELVVRQLGFLERRIFVNNDERTGVWSCAERIVNEAGRRASGRRVAGSPISRTYPHAGPYIPRRPTWKPGRVGENRGLHG